MSKNVFLEINIDSAESAVAAEQGGAKRVELCSDLAEGGVTPSTGMIEITRKRISIPLFVMIRPRPGEFCYSDTEFEIIKQDIGLAKKLGADGVVFGILRQNGAIDSEKMKALIQLARPMQVTFHRAFDTVNDPISALDELITLGVDRLLTSGQANSAFGGMPVITELVKRANDRIAIMPGCGINEENIRTIRETCGVSEFHIGTAAHGNKSGEGRFEMGSHAVVEAEKVKAIAIAAGKA